MLQNDFEFTGRVSKIEVKYIDNGTCITRFCMAKKCTKRGKEDKYMFFWFDMFGDIAEKFANEIKEGDTVNAIGKIENDTYEDKTTRKNVTKTVFKCWKYTKAEYDSVKKEFVACTSNSSDKGEIPWD